MPLLFRPRNLELRPCLLGQALAGIRGFRPCHQNIVFPSPTCRRETSSSSAARLHPAVLDRDMMKRSKCSELGSCACVTRFQVVRIVIEVRQDQKAASCEPKPLIAVIYFLAERVGGIGLITKHVCILRIDSGYL